jgi:hypothetical protein
MVLFALSVGETHGYSDLSPPGLPVMLEDLLYYT